MAFSLGLSAVPRGYMDADQQQVGTDINRLKLDEGQIAIQGQHALGRAIFQATQPGAMPMPPGPGPQPPAPGQASMPSQFDQPPGPMAQGSSGMPPGGQQLPFMGGMPGGGAPPMPQQPPMQTGGASAGPPPPSPMGGQGGMPRQFDLQTVVAKIQQANPGIPPRVLIAALNQATPLINAEGKLQLAQMMAQLRVSEHDRKVTQGDERLDIAKGESQRRTTQGNERLDIAQGGEERKTEQGNRRLDQADAREGRLSAAAIVRQDQAYQRLELQKQDMVRKIEAREQGASLAQLRAIITAQHNRAMEIINANATNMPAAQKKALEAEARASYEDSIKNIQNLGKAKPKPETPQATPAPSAPRPRAKGQAGQPDLEWDGTAWVPVQ